MRCQFCECEHFTEVEGFYYCLDCDKRAEQSQIRLKESFVGQEKGGGGGGDLERDDQEERPTTSSGGGGGTKKPKHYFVDGGVPWVTSEAMAFVFKNQIERVIAHGAHPTLMNSAFRVWSLYLSKLGLAFVEDPLNLNLPYFKLRPGGRDLMPPTIDNPWLLDPVLLWNKTDLTSAHEFHLEDLPEEDQASGSAPASDKLIEDQAIKRMRVSRTGSTSGVKRSHKIFMSSQANLDLQEEEDNIGNVIIGRFRKDFKEINYAKRKYAKVPNRTCKSHHTEERLRTKPSESLRSFSPYRWLPSKTLCLLYLSLLISGHYVTPAMILRWVKLGIIPFRDMRNCLPKEFVLQTHDDVQLLCGRLPTLQSFTFFIRFVADFLQLKVLPLPPFELVVARCIEQLSLPKDFYNFVLSFVEKVPVCRTDSGKSYRFAVEFDSLALAYVLVALKVVLAIDDVLCQGKLQKLSKKLQEIFNNHPNVDSLRLFEVSEWLSLFETVVEGLKRSEEDLDNMLTEFETMELAAPGKTRKDLIQDKVPAYDQARATLQTFFSEIEASLLGRLRPAQRANAAKEKEEAALATLKDRLSEFRNSRSAHFGVDTCEELIQAFQLKKEHFSGDGLNSEISAILKEIQAALTASTLSTRPFNCKTRFEDLAQQFPLYYRITKAACYAVVPSISLCPSNVHLIVCTIEAEATGKPDLVMPHRFLKLFRDKHFKKR